VTVPHLFGWKSEPSVGFAGGHGVYVGEKDIDHADHHGDRLAGSRRPTGKALMAARTH
jgi:hypothetical protein